MATIVKYWPAVVAGLYLAYVAAAGNATAVPGAIAALLSTLGVNVSVNAAHAKISQSL